VDANVKNVDTRLNKQVALKDETKRSEGGSFIFNPTFSMPYHL